MLLRVACCVLLAVLHAPAFAQSARDVAAARSLFRDALTAADAANWEEAASLFERAQALRPSPAIALNLASALKHLERLVEAPEPLHRVIRNDETTRRLRLRAQRQLDALLPRLGELTVVVDGEVAGVTFRLDTQPLAAAAIGVATPTDPGPHRVVALRDDEEVASSELVIEEGGRHELRLTVPPRAIEVPSPREVAEEQNEPSQSVSGVLRVEPVDVAKPLRRQWWLWTAIAVGVGVVVGGAVLGTRSRRSEQSVCDDLVLGCAEP